jgi:hypothetical protein
LAFSVSSSYKITPDTPPVKLFIPKSYDISNTKDYLIENKFMPLFIQSMITKTHLLRSNNLQFVAGGVGQDTLFSQEFFLCQPGRGLGIKTETCLYYADREGSVVNSITSQYFRKCLPTEKACVETMRKYGLLDKYIELRLEYFVKVWYLEKMKQVPRDDLKQSLELLVEILSLYEMS